MIQARVAQYSHGLAVRHAKHFVSCWTEEFGRLDGTKVEEEAAAEDNPLGAGCDAPGVPDTELP